MATINRSTVTQATGRAATAARTGLRFANVPDSVKGQNLELFARSLGIRTLQTLAFNVPSARYENPNDYPKSILNTPVYNAITFGNINNPENEQEVQQNVYIDIDGNAIPYEPIVLDCVIVTISNTKNIITTPIQGYNGTVKEYVSDGDYQINIRGYIATKDFIYPRNDITLPADVERLVNICQIPAAIPVESELFNIFGIEDIVITDYEFPEREGYRNQQEFNINAISDRIINLEDVTIEE